MRPDRLVLVLATLFACEASPSASVAGEAASITAVLVGCARLDEHTCTRPPPGPATRCEPTRRPSDDSDAFTPVVWLADARAGDEVR
ncbi:MAG TPA: hypothetical protein VFG69_04280, partial [Nannocystaceae bacterium]|nr:hypothetical protein [Nannocystaceae bacterium]